MKGLLFLIALVSVVAGKHFPILSTGREAESAWRKSGRAQGGKIQFRLNFELQNQDWLDRTFEAITSPGSPDYGKYMTTTEVAEKLSPTLAQKQKLYNFLKTNSISYKDYGLHVKCSSTVAQFERVFSTKLYRARNLMSKKKGLPRFGVKAFDGMHVPDEILDILSPVYPVGGAVAVLEPPRKLAVVPKPDGSIQTAVVPQTLEVQYDIQGLSINPPFGKITQAVAEFSNDDSYAPSDLSEFSRKMLVNIEGKVQHHGPFNPNPADAESTLDIQYIASTGRNGTSSFWVVSGWLTEFLQDLQASGNPPDISSISWGADERQEGASVNEAIDKLFQALTLSGCTFLAASGDSGAPGIRGSCPSGQYQLNPGYPATSPFVLSVGATMFDSVEPGHFKSPFCLSSSIACAGKGHEVPADVTNIGFSSGGGYSTYAAQPSWQSAAVQKYNNDASIPKPPSQYYNKNNRGFPDVSAQGWNVFIYIQGQPEEIGGTSASSPIFAGMLSLLNDHQRKRGKPVLGFVNPLVYKMANSTGIFTKIGDSSTNNQNGCSYGFTSASASQGLWDPVTGLGVLRVAKAIEWLDQNL